MSDLSDTVKCPVCGSHEIFMRGGGWKDICLICYHRFSRTLPEASTTPQHRRIKTVIALIAFGVCASTFGLTAVAIHAGRNSDVPDAPFNQDESEVPTSAGAEDVGSAGARAAQVSKKAFFGGRRWVKGVMHRPSSCVSLQDGVTPQDDAIAADSDSAIVGALASDNEYDLVYSDGMHVSVYSSSVSECRRVVNRWSWRY
jgi:hypothetical protein